MRVKTIILFPSNIHPISKTKESILFSDCMLIECIYVFLAHEGTHEYQKRWLWKVKIRDEFIDNSEFISWSDIDSGLKVQSSEFMVHHNRVNPVHIVHILSERIPVILSFVVQWFFHGFIENSPERRKWFQRTTDGCSYRDSFLPIFLVCGNSLEETEFDLDGLTMDMIITNVGNINSLECPEPDMKRHIFFRILDTPEELFTKVKRCRWGSHWAAIFSESSLIVFFFFFAVFDIGWEWEFSIFLHQEIDRYACCCEYSPRICYRFHFEWSFIKEDLCTDFELISGSHECFEITSRKLPTKKNLPICYTPMSTIRFHYISRTEWNTSRKNTRIVEKYDSIRFEYIRKIEKYPFTSNGGASSGSYDHTSIMVRMNRLLCDEFSGKWVLVGGEIIVSHRQKFLAKYTTIHLIDNLFPEILLGFSLFSLSFILWFSVCTSSYVSSSSQDVVCFPLLRIRS